MPPQIPPAAVSRFKFAVPIVADMLNKRYRRRQFDSADSEFGDLEKNEYKGNPLLSGGGFSLSKNFYHYQKWGLGHSPKAGRRDASPRIFPLSGERGAGGIGIVS